MSISPTKSLQQFVKSAVLVVASCFATVANAGIIDFEDIASPIVFDGQRTTLGEYNIDSFGENVPGSLVGTMGNNDICTGFGIACPKNNLTNYYNVLADSYFVLSKVDNQKFQLKSLQASFIGTGQTSFNGTAGAIELFGFDANDNVVDYTPLFLSGPVAGQFMFADFTLGAFGMTDLSYLLVVGSACDNSGCSRSGNRANFAIDNIVTADVITADVPEPGSLAMLMLALAGLGAVSRRRSV